MVRNTLTRAQAGEVLISHKGKSIPTSVGSTSYETQYNGDLLFDLVPRTGSIPSGYEHRPDLIADLFYGGTKNWWKVCETNLIFDVFEQLDSGDILNLPR